ncbi:MAG: 2-oxoacid:acceptor oxidoreductase subunit alpha [Chloroflexi bacterium]|nr:2-oxoacid:acceptor oxidoreductase subunit alpha [Chloroflexota bacterium]
MDFNFMVGGEAGQGVQTVGYVLAKAMSRGGLYVYADQDYESRIRGGHNFYRVRVSDKEVGALSETADVLIALNKESIDLHREEVRRGGSIVFDGEAVKPDKAEAAALFDVPMGKLATETAGSRLMTNSVATGSAIGLVDYDFAILEKVLREQFARSGEEVVEKNVKAARAGFDHARQERGRSFGFHIKPQRPAAKRMLLSANEAMSLAAMAAGCKFMAAYPMTPATSIMEYVADKGRDFNIVVMQPEDEISVVNMVIGAAYAGVRAMTATSGGGFCLMVEALSLAGMTETPIVVVLGQRPGPAIGLPTRTEQGELEFALHAGHGEFPRAILAPATVEDAFDVTVKAFNLAEKYQTPVIIITDHLLATSYQTIARFDVSKVKIDRGLLLSEEESNKQPDYKRYTYTESGVSPRALPGLGKSVVVADSDEHNEEGHIIEDSETRTKMMLKRLRKLDGLRTEIGAPRFHRSPKSEMTLIGWGSTYGAINEAVALLEKDGVAASHLHLSELWPFPAEAVAAALKGSKKTVVIENNATGQLAHLMRAETGIKADKCILKFDGRPFSPAHIVRELKKEA